ncbi:hypothetical protein Vadar_022893 [Vaccinium darrowii]|uniref:Uncharacterized protein n=1 Tax=Vaccinium darrowii TaxID=229202 RepID=A0ACB7Y1L4_9ERIC|nr:hypothetical protein Vadar_022893 [Vaccinium darrowii]
MIRSCSQLFTLFVDNFPDTKDQIWLERTFSNYGIVRDVCIPVKRSKKGSKFGFVCFDCSVAAGIAIYRANGLKVDGRQLHVKRASFELDSNKNDIRKINGTTEASKKGEGRRQTNMEYRVVDRKSYAQAVKAIENRDIQCLVANLESEKGDVDMAQNNVDELDGLVDMEARNDGGESNKTKNNTEYGEGNRHVEDDNYSKVSKKAHLIEGKTSEECNEVSSNAEDIEMVAESEKANELGSFERGLQVDNAIYMKPVSSEKGIDDKIINYTGSSSSIDLSIAGSVEREPNTNASNADVVFQDKLGYLGMSFLNTGAVGLPPSTSTHPPSLLLADLPFQHHFQSSSAPFSAAVACIPIIIRHSPSSFVVIGHSPSSFVVAACIPIGYWLGPIESVVLHGWFGTSSSE